MMASAGDNAYGFSSCHSNGAASLGLAQAAGSPGGASNELDKAENVRMATGTEPRIEERITAFRKRRQPG